MPVLCFDMHDEDDNNDGHITGVSWVPKCILWHIFVAVENRTSLSKGAFHMLWHSCHSSIWEKNTYETRWFRNAVILSHRTHNNNEYESQQFRYVVMHSRRIHGAKGKTSSVPKSWKERWKHTCFDIFVTLLMLQVCCTVGKSMERTYDLRCCQQQHQQQQLQLERHTKASWAKVTFVGFVIQMRPNACYLWTT